MKYLNKTVALALLTLSIVSCSNKRVKQVLNFKGEHVADSIFVNGLIEKIIFVDTTYYIDSIVFYRYCESVKLRSRQVFKKGRNVFENTYYFENGKLEKYLFINPYCSECYYERVYYLAGNLMHSSGTIFFQQHIDDYKGLPEEFKKGAVLYFNVFYPNPPDCDVEVYMKDEETDSTYNVFYKSHYLNFLSVASYDINKAGYFKGVIEMKFRDRVKDTTMIYNNQYVYRVVD